ncbi:hypothetical protein H2248_003122 [Termitomyces sp. 'cryptogamus']|nr:hypothetical protein H2248_003122 [Termitomyces sp. 'cryptogamus']
MFNFEVIYVPGSENILSDTLSRIYSNDAPGTIRAGSEYTQFDDLDVGPTGELIRPVLAGMEGALSALGKPVVVGTEGMSVSFIGELEVSNPGGGEEAGGNTLFQKPETGAPVRRSSRFAEKLKTAVQHNVIVDSPPQSEGIEGGNRDTVVVEQVPVQAKKMNKRDNK